MEVTLATCVTLPEPDVDEPLLSAALAERGVAARLVAWDDPGARWDAPLTIVRSTWNYHHRLADFLAWVDRVDSGTRLLNPAPVLRWNAHKRYLADLAARGVAVVPTTFLDRGTRTDLGALLATLRLDDAVVKPAVSAGSFSTRRVRGADAARDQAWFADLLAARDVMVQPYVASTEGYGERALVFVDGEPMHAVRKSPRFADGVEVVSEALDIAPDELALARRALACVGGRLLYARVDVARDAVGRPMVMELELIEPSLFLKQNPAALERFADAIVRRARGG